MRFARSGLLMVLGIALVACSGEKETGEGGASKEQAQEPAKAARQSEPEPAAPAPETGVADATAEPERRFDMTQGGEAQTAEKFETWMEDQGIRVADGEQAEKDDASANPTSDTTPAKAEEARQ